MARRVSVERNDIVNLGTSRMARNEEKANSLLNRWQALKSEVRFGTERARWVAPASVCCARRAWLIPPPPCRRRPFLASECNSLPQAEKWRHEIIREITQLVTKIQNGAAHDCAWRRAALTVAAPQPPSAST